MALKELSTNGKLDAVLKYLNGEYIKSKNSDVIHVEAFDFKSRSEIGLGVSFAESSKHIDELELILEYLSDVEHYISKLGKGGPYEQYRILYSGKVFIEAGGYTGHQKSLVHRVAWEDGIQEANRKNGQRLNWLTFWLAAITSALFLVELIKFLIDYNMIF